MGKLYSLISALLLAVGAAFAAPPSGYEWWFDSDVSSVRSGELPGRTMELDIDPSSLPRGVHFFNLRLSSGEGGYGTVYRRMFHYYGDEDSAVSYEYWIDSDHAARTTGGMTAAGGVIELDASGIPSGAHFFNLRLGYGDGSWGTVYRQLLLCLPGNSVDATGYEYWIDTNYASRTAGTLTAGENVYTVDLDGLRHGLHRFNYRIRTGSGDWGSVFTSYFYMASNAARFTEYEYWLDTDYANRKSAKVSANPVAFDLDLDGFDKSCGPHAFSLRVRDDDGDWGTVYRKLLVFTSGDGRVPIIGYRHFINGVDHGYVEVERTIADKYMFEVELVDEMISGGKGAALEFDGDNISVNSTDSITYTLQLHTELGWAAPEQWNVEVGSDFSTTAVEMQVNTHRVFDTPGSGEFAAVRFTSTGVPLYFRADTPIGLDIYRNGEVVTSLAAAQVAEMAMVQLEAGEYFGILHDAADEAPEQFTFHIMDTPNVVPSPEISFDRGMVRITCSRDDAEIRYTTDGNPPTAESALYREPFPLLRNAVVKAMAYVPGSDIEPSEIVEYVVDSYKVPKPTGVFNPATRVLTISCEMEEAAILYTFNPDGEWLEYEAPVQMRSNRTVYARATFEGYNDSDIAEIAVTGLPVGIPTPEISFTDGSVTITCGLEGAEIHFSTNGTPPGDVEDMIYIGPFAMNRNGVVMAIAYMPGLDLPPSEVATYTVDTYKVSTPTWSFDADSRLLTLGCDTEGAAIYYSSDAGGGWTSYTSPIEIRSNRTLYAYAARDGYNDSDRATIVIDGLPDGIPTPEISFTDGSVTITCGLEGAEIHFSTNGTPPGDVEDMIYIGPFAMNRNGVVMAIAYMPGLDLPPSEIATYTIDTYKVSTPTWSFDAGSRLLTLGCDTDGAAIYYSSDAGGGWTSYTSPIEIRSNRTLYAYATRDGYNDSDPATIVINELPDGIPMPEISFSDGSVTITCGLEGAEIHFSTNGTPPGDVEDMIYIGPFAMNRNGVVMAIAYMPGLDLAPSDVATYTIDTYKVSTPTWSFDAGSRLLTLGCDTDGAAIYYSSDAGGGWTSYTSPIEIRSNRTLYAYATRDGYNDSDPATIVIDGLPDGIPTPEISFSGGMVEITCSLEGAVIHYSLDGNPPSPESDDNIYTSPFAMNRNGVIMAVAVMPGLDLAPSDVATYTVDTYKVSTPTWSFDAGSRLLTLGCDTEGATITYAFDPDGEWIDYTRPVEIDGNVTVYARATCPGYHDSDIAEIEISEFKCAPVSIAYNGRYAALTTDEPNATIMYTTDGSDPVDGLTFTSAFDVAGLCRIRAVAVKDGYMDSEIAEYEVTGYADEQHAVTSSGGLLSSCYGWAEKGVTDNLHTLRVEGVLNESDYGFLRSMPALRHLDMERVGDAEIPDRAFAGTGLISISMPQAIARCGDEILAGASSLCALIWNMELTDLATAVTEDIDNPNVLIYVRNGVGVDDPRALNVIEEGYAQSITLHYGYPYHAPREFRAAYVSQTREFTLPTEIGKCGGWETIVLPFAPDSITHETAGPITPFAAWDGDLEGAKPFWLYASSYSGWWEAREMEACVPYIISMPNCQDYIDSFNLNGKVTFSARDVKLGPETNEPLSTTWAAYRLVGTFMPVEDPDVLALNISSPEDGQMAGSMFVDYEEAVPFGAYVRGAGSRRAIPVFGDWNGVNIPIIENSGLTVDSPAHGTIRIHSTRDRRVDIITVDGMAVCSLSIRAGETVVVEDLLRNYYICGGIKVLVR